jgi:hypothetical protein
MKLSSGITLPLAAMHELQVYVFSNVVEVGKVKSKVVPVLN